MILGRAIATIEEHTDLTKEEIECFTLDEIDNLVDTIQKVIFATSDLESLIKRLRKKIDK